jgi:hypothetical protein
MHIASYSVSSADTFSLLVYTQTKDFSRHRLKKAAKRASHMRCPSENYTV